MGRDNESEDHRACELVTLMRAMAERDAQALFLFIEAFRADLTTMVRSIIGSLGRRDVQARSEDVEFLVHSAALIIHDRASRWQSDGAAPWVWAKRAIRAEVVAWLGHPRVEFVPEWHAPGQPPPRVTSDINLAMLAEEHEEIAVWLAEVREVASERDERVHIEYQTQKSLGDPSPAHTVGAEFGLKPDNVRQIDARVRKKLATAGSVSPIMSG